MVGFACTEYRHLSHTESVGYEVLNQESAQSVGWSQCIDIAIVVVRANFSNDGYLAFFGDISC